MKDDQWIIDHANELKVELLRRARAKMPRPKKGTILYRALKLFTTPPKDKSK